MTSPAAAPPWGPIVRRNAANSLQATLNANGSLRQLCSGELSVTLFPSGEVESGPGNLVLRRIAADGTRRAVPLLGPSAPGRARQRGERRWVEGDWDGLHYRLELVLAAQATAWFWHVELFNATLRAEQLDLLLLQDVALAPWAAVRLNEAYVSHYIDHQPLLHARHGSVIASRQNQPAEGRAPWLMSGCLGRAVAWATDARQLWPANATGLADPTTLSADLPSTRWQHEHSLVALQSEPIALASGARTQCGFFGWLQADHPAASGLADLAVIDQVMGLPEARWIPPPSVADDGGNAASLFSTAPVFAAKQPEPRDLRAWYPGPWRHVESDAQGVLQSFFAAADTHVVTHAKARAVLRPHGHLMRSGAHWTPDECATTSTAWMAGVFHSALTQGHASANRLLSNLRGHLGFYRAQGLRIFVDAGDGWHLLHQPSAFSMTPQVCTWHYRSEVAHLVVRAEAALQAPEVHLSLEVLQGPPLQVLIVQHGALDNDDGLGEGALRWQPCDGGLRLDPDPLGDLARRFPGGHWRLLHAAGSAWHSVHGDEALFLDGRSRQQPYLCLRYDAARTLSLTLRGALLNQAGTALRGDAPPGDRAVRLQAPVGPSAQADGVQQLGEWLPWLNHNAQVHYLAPRGLEQYSGGGWGTRDVCQGPAEWLAALGRHDALREVLLRVFTAQNADGDWPQWFMFFERDAHVRAGDSHGDIVFWPLLALADYLAATGDAGLLDERVPYHGKDAITEALSAHVERAWAVVRGRRVAGTELAAYGHGDWNDALQPADPALRDRLCSAWTVTLHVRTLRAWVAALQRLGHADRARVMQHWCDAVQADFQRLLVVDGVVVGYASFDPGGSVEHLLHPRDARTGIRYSALPMVHGIIDELFTPAQAAAHVALIGQHLSGPDGLRLFDWPLRYAGGPMRLFQRGESAAYFGREIGLMYMHAHLRWAEALAHLGQADAFFQALRLANPIALQGLVPQAAPRQANCYYSSSDAAFVDRDEAWTHYERIADGQVALEGGWRVYSSGAGIAFRLVVQCLLGLKAQTQQWIVDPVIPPGLDGMGASVHLQGRDIQVVYRVGPVGHGPRRVRCNGVDLPLHPLANRYRQGGASIAIADLQAALRDHLNRLEIEIG